MTGEQIKEAVERLPASFRRIFILSEVEGFTYKEIARIEDCPLGTVMSRLFRVRRALKALYGSTWKNGMARSRNPEGRPTAATCGPSG